MIKLIFYTMTNHDFYHHRRSLRIMGFLPCRYEFGASFRLCSNSSNDKTELIKWNKKAKLA